MPGLLASQPTEALMWFLKMVRVECGGLEDLQKIHLFTYIYQNCEIRKVEVKTCHLKLTRVPVAG